MTTIKAFQFASRKAVGIRIVFDPKNEIVYMASWHMLDLLRRGELKEFELHKSIPNQREEAKGE